jgi:hypothetical protein
MMSEAEDEIHFVLSDALSRLTGNTRFTVAEFGGAGAVIVRVYRDANGTPQAEEPFPEVRAAALRNVGVFYGELAPVCIVRTADTLPAELEQLLADTRGVPVYPCRTSLKQLVRDAIRISPLVQGYELAALRKLPDGYVELVSRPLFPVGSSTGIEVKATVAVEPTDSEGTTFAVVTRDPRPEIPPLERDLQPVQVESAVIDPGTHELTVRLDRPGRVTFPGLSMLAKSPAGSDELWRLWRDRLRRVPERLTKAARVHLVCVVEATGGDVLMGHRIDRLAKLISEAEQGVSELNVSVISYGPHSVSWALDEEPYRVRLWVGPGQAAERALRVLPGRVASELEYPLAAQLECVLHGLAGHLAAADGRPVIVTAGGRPPHPDEMDTNTGLIPCPDRVNWRRHIDAIDGLGASFGALHDPNCTGAIWGSLGRDASGTVDDAVDITDFAARLGLREAGQTVPFPFID